MSDEAVTATCHCGAVRLDLDAAPAEVTECNCSVCHRYGVLWAYYPPAAVRIRPAEAPTDTYLWDDRSIAFHRCATCGCVTHWSPVGAERDRMGVNARLLPPAIVAAAKVRHLDGAGTEDYVD